MTDMPPLALLAGGMATRLRPLTASLPKSLIPVAGEPFIAHQLRLMRREGIEHVVLCVGFLSEQIREFVGDGGQFGLQVSYCEDGAVQLGTGGAIRKALPYLGPEFMVMYGDSWLDSVFAPIVAAFRSSGKPALMTVFRNNGMWVPSNIWFEGGRIKRYDKLDPLPQMQHVDWGLSVAKAELFARMPDNTPFDLVTVYGDLCTKGDLAGFEVKERFYEIGSIEGLRETDALLRKSDHSRKPAARPSS
jgi:NDP-sugar pyrophosphorylase family protein